MGEKKEYIERGALLKKNMYGNTAPILHRTYAEMLIQSAPVADVVEVVHGEWIKNNGERSCMYCGFTYYSIDHDFNYCPHCGAKMDGGKE